MTKRVVLVTGGGSGIGKEICRRLHREGAQLLVVSLLQRELDELAAELGPDGPAVHTLALDLTEPDAAEQVMRFCDDLGVTVDVLINNAGFGLHGPHVGLPAEQTRAMLRLNVVAVSSLCQLFGARMAERGAGTILNVGSTSGFQALPNLAAYAASKAFVVSFTQALAAELRGHRVRVHCVCPGTTKTPFLDVAGLGESKAVGSTAYLAHKVAMPPQVVADVACDLLASGDDRRVVVVPGITNALHYHATHWLPRRLVQPLVNVLFNRD